jgi:hypothetical protein
MASQQELARYLDLSERSVRDLIARSVLPERGSRGWDLQACLTRYIAFLRGVAVGRTGRGCP